MEPFLTIQNAHKAYGNHQALKGVDLDLHKGEWLGLLGPNGAGKTSLIRAIAGRVRLNQGEIQLGGQLLKPGKHLGRSKLGVVPQNLAIYPTLTAQENLMIFGKLHGVKGAKLKERVAWALDWVALSDRANQTVKGFSGGMQRRLNIAAAVLHEPQCILLDEPTVGVDPQSRERIWEMLSQLKDNGAAILLTTHQLDEAQEACDRVVIIDHGAIIANGTLDQLIDQTIGRHRLVQVHLEPKEGAEDMIEQSLEDVVRDLPLLLNEIRDQGRDIRDMRIRVPNLQSVFIHLTGRELRE